MADMKEKLNQATEGLKQVKSKLEPYFEKAKPFLRRATELTWEGMKAAATKASQLKDDYLQKKAAEKENLAKTSNPVTPPVPEAKKDSEQPPKDL